MAQTDFGYIDEDFAINRICPKFLSLNDRSNSYSCDRKGKFKKNIRKQCISHSSKATCIT